MATAANVMTYVGVTPNSKLGYNSRYGNRSQQSERHPHNGQLHAVTKNQP